MLSGCPSKQGWSKTAFNKVAPCGYKELSWTGSATNHGNIQLRGPLKDSNRNAEPGVPLHRQRLLATAGRTGSLPGQPEGAAASLLRGGPWTLAL